MIFSKKCMIFNHFLRKKNVPGQKPTMCIAMDKEIFDTDGFSLNLGWNGILFQKLLWPSVSSNNQENFCKTFETFRTIYSNMKGKDSFWNSMFFFTCSWRFLRPFTSEQLHFSTHFWFQFLTFLIFLSKKILFAISTQMV